MPGEFNWDKVIESHEATGVEPAAASAEGSSKPDELENILNLIPDRNGKTPDQLVDLIPEAVATPALDLTAEPIADALELIHEMEADVEPVAPVPVEPSVPAYMFEEPVALEHEVPLPPLQDEPAAAPQPVPAPALADTFQLPTPPPELDEPFVPPTPPVVDTDSELDESFELPKPPPTRPDFLNQMASPYEQLPADSSSRKLSDERMKDLPTPPKHVSPPPLAAPQPIHRMSSANVNAPSQSMVQDIYSGKDEDRFEIFSDPANQLMSDSYAAPLENLHLDDVLRLAVERRASDIHFTAGLPPMARIDGEVLSLPYAITKPGDCRRLLMEILNDEQIQKFEKTHELDLSYSVRDTGRFRVNIYMQRGTVAAAIRSIPSRIPGFEELNLPPILREVSQRTSGLILVTGPTGSGKSTSIAAMIDDINSNRNGHIMTIEDPIEYLHKHKKCMVNQREMHGDTYSFHNALRAVLREDPDIILVGELRDLETIEAALTLAETGHLVFGTLHTRNAPATIDRLVDVFPSDQQDQIRVLLGNTLEGVISQQLLPKIGGGRIAALEVMVGLPSVRNLIREGKTHQLYSVIETGKQHGMFTMDGSLAGLFRSGIVSYDECILRAVDKESFARLAKAAA